MSTPYMAFAVWCKGMFFSFWTLWAFTLVISRVYIFHEAYQRECGVLEDELYLLEKCKDPEFYSNIRQHTDICTQVHENSKSSTFLKALNTMALNTHTCGISPCTDLAQDIVDRLGWQVLGLLALVVLVCPNALMIGYRMIRSNTTLPLERALYSKHRRFGVEYPCTDAPFHEEYASFKEAGSLRRRALTGMVSV